jgi:hypothetical protein
MTNTKNFNSNLNSFFIQISKWFQASRFVLNVEKTNIVKVTSSRSSIYSLRTSISYARYNITEATTVKFLGLHLDSQLMWKAHVNFLLNKLSSVCYIMRRLVHILNLETLKVIYFVHFHSLISYGIIFWGNSSSMHKIFITQKRILRIMLGLGPRCSCRRWFVKLSILTVPSLYIYSLIMFVYNNLGSFASNSSIHNFNTRSRNHLCLPRVNLFFVQKGVTYTSLRIFNALPSTLIQLQTNKFSFKLALRKYLLVNAFYSVDVY